MNMVYVVCPDCGFTHTYGYVCPKCSGGEIWRGGTSGTQYLPYMGNSFTVPAKYTTGGQYEETD